MNIKNKYLLLLGNIPDFLNKYLKSKSLNRLKKIGYFCGMDYASKDIYDFKEYISRYDHSLSVALLTWKLTKNKISTLKALFHDISTPCFSHVIDYMNKDYKRQESTEIYTEDILKNDKNLLNCLKEDKILLEDIINFKEDSIVDNERPKLCTDRLDGVILTSLFWTKNMDISDVKSIIDNLEIYINEYNEKEIGFKNNYIKDLIIENNKLIDIYCHSKEDNYMMELLANITRLAINKSIITYEKLYELNELELFDILEKNNNIEIKKLIYKFKNIKKEEIPNINLPDVKIRTLKPLVKGVRL